MNGQWRRLKTDPRRLRLPDSVYGRLMLIVSLCVGVPVGIALALAPDDHRVSLIGALCLLIPPVAIGVYLAARSITRQLTRLRYEAESLGRGVEIEPHDDSGPRELRMLSMSFDLAQARVQSYV